jgi:membrane protease YdiL (CAAX protease family)
VTGEDRPLADERFLVLALTALITIAPLVSLASATPVAIAILGVTILAWRRRAVAATALGIFSVACVVLGVAGIGPQQVVFSIAFAISAVILWRVPWLRESTAWFERGAFDRSLLVMAVGIAGLAAAALIVWYVAARPDLADVVRTFVRDQPLWLLAPGALVFSAVNAATEEGAYRGLLLGALDATLGRGHVRVADARGDLAGTRVHRERAEAGVLPVLLQAVAFGALHLQGGFPRGVIGVGLAFVYGLLLGALRRRAGGLLAPWAAHVLTDLAIATIVLTLAR